MSTLIPTDNESLNSYYIKTEEEFVELIKNNNLDITLKLNPDLMAKFEDLLNFAFVNAYEKNNNSNRAHLFLQRVLYYINRLNLFWFDDIENYINDDSTALFSLSKQIETEWAKWELNHIQTDSLECLPLEEALNKRVNEDLNPLPSEETLFLRNEMLQSGYKRLLAISSLDGLVEASQLSRVLGGVGNEIQLMLAKIFWEEYGGGKLSHKHSSYFITMLKELNMETVPEAYFDLVPWEVLANINHSFLLSEKKKNYLRYVGGLLYIEVSAPSAFQNYQKAGERIGLTEAGTGYWSTHIKEDIRHGEWMLNKVAVPLAKKYPDQAWQVILGYDQQKFISSRAVKSIVGSIRKINNY
jgi:hypothetical protein